jgi:hypothetical protein
MTGQIQLFKEITIFDAADVFANAPAHNRNVSIGLPDGMGICDESAGELVPVDFMPIYMNWPKRDWGDEPIGEFYSKLKPRQIGLFEVSALVKENEKWVLHGKVLWNGGDRLDNSQLTSPYPIIQSVDIVRGDPTQGRRAIRLDRLMVNLKVS